MSTCEENLRDVSKYFRARIKGAVLAGTIIFWSASVSAALQNVNQSLQAQTNLVQLNAIFIDKHGRVVSDIQPNEVSITDQDRSQPISVFEPPLVERKFPDNFSTTSDLKLPVAEQQRDSILYVLIAIPGMGFTSRIAAINAVSKYARRTARLSTTFVAVADASGAVLPFTDDPQQLREFTEYALRPAISGYETASFLPAAMKLLEDMRKFGGRKALVVFTDFFVPNNPIMWTSPASVFVPKALDVGASVYPTDVRGVTTVIPYGDASKDSEDVNISPGFSSHPGPEVLNQVTAEVWSYTLQQQQLMSVARATGGKYDGSNDSSAIFDRVETDLRSTYVLGYYIHDLPADGRFHSIRINVSRHGIQTRARIGYFAPVRLQTDLSGLNSVLVADRPLNDIQTIPRLLFFPISDRDQQRIVLNLDFRWSLESVNSSTVHELTIAGRIWSNSGATVASFNDRRHCGIVAVNLGGVSPFVTCQYNVVVDLAPGNYRAKVASLSATGQPGSAFFQFSVRKQERKSIRTSSLVLSDHLLPSQQHTPPDVADPLIVAGDRVVPQSVHEFAAKDTIILFARVTSSRDKSTFHADLLVKDGSDRTIFGPIPVPLVERRHDTSGLGLPILYKLNPAGLKTGYFVAELRIKQLHGGAATAKTSFRIIDSPHEPQTTESP
ncbi:MAG TPA: VWA domain-containing protein [Terriglobales bacterium]|nr:VWA domain-containing protein [Terriglobales bacterium]